MARKDSKAQKSQIVAFKVEEELAKFLDNLPNKSEFIRKAILAQFGMTCPLTADAAPAADQKRIEQFLHGGPLYCARCYPTMSSCDDCGWHVGNEKMVE